MPQIQLDTMMTLIRNLPDLVEQLRIANELKALELKLKFHGNVEPIPEWVGDVDKLVARSRS